MVKRKTAQKIRKAHRYLGLFLGIQFLMWTLSGLYFSWTDIDEIHGDHFIKESVSLTPFTGLLGTEDLQTNDAITSLQLIDIGGVPYYWINEADLFHARTGERKDGVTEQEALKVAEHYMRSELEVAGVKRIEEAGPHSEYRGKPLPAYEITYASQEAIKVYIAIENGTFQTVRHRSWRWFDFLWMTHTMDYQGRDDFNTMVLRAFSVLGLITVLSGFTLWFISSPSIRRIRLTHNSGQGELQ